MRLGQNCYVVHEFPSWFHLCRSGLGTATELLVNESEMVLPMRSLTLLLG
jgi:hypothetical protein